MLTNATLPQPPGPRYCVGASCKQLLHDGNPSTTCGRLMCLLALQDSPGHRATSEAVERDLKARGLIVYRHTGASPAPFDWIAVHQGLPVLLLKVYAEPCTTDRDFISLVPGLIPGPTHTLAGWEFRRGLVHYDPPIDNRYPKLPDHP